MAIDWYRTDAALFRHPKVFRLDNELKQERTGWYVHGLWSWLVTYASHGRFAASCAADVERACDWRGEPGRLVAAFLSAGWLDDDGSGDLSAHDWEEKQSAIAEKAEKDAARKRRERARRRGVTGARPSADSPRDISRDRPRDGAGTRRDETVRDGTVRDVEDKGPPPPVVVVKPVPLPASPDNRFASGDAYWAHVQNRRYEAGGVVERPPDPRRLSSWWSEVGMELNGDYEALDDGLARFGANKHWEHSNPPWPFAAFMKNWRDYVRR